MTFILCRNRLETVLFGIGLYIKENSGNSQAYLFRFLAWRLMNNSASGYRTKNGGQAGMQSSEVSKASNPRVEAILPPETATQPVPDKTLLLARLRRRFLETYHHRPRRLFVAINGITVASLDVVFRKNELRVATNLLEPLQFIEIFTEQNVRLALLNADMTCT